MTTAAFGMMIAVGDYKGDLDAIVNVLNSLKNVTQPYDSGRWIVFGDDTIGYDTLLNQYPTVFPIPRHPRIRGWTRMFCRRCR